MNGWKIALAAAGLALAGCGGAQAEEETTVEAESEDDSHFPEDAMEHYEPVDDDDAIDDEAIDGTDDEMP